MKFKLHTYDIQLLDIALIYYGVCCKDNDGVLTKEDNERLRDKLMELNNLCNKENDYTLHITVES